jgi:hypothetical protein
VGLVALIPVVLKKWKKRRGGHVAAK